MKNQRRFAPTKTGRLAPEWVAAFLRNQWPESAEYAIEIIIQLHDRLLVEQLGFIPLAVTTTGFSFYRMPYKHRNNSLVDFFFEQMVGHGMTEAVECLVPRSSSNPAPVLEL